MSAPRFQVYSLFFLAFASLLPLHLVCAAASSSPSGVGDLERGSFKVMLYRGAVTPFEATVMATPNDCAGRLVLNVWWNRHHNDVSVQLTGAAGSLEPFPDVYRTSNVDYCWNGFFPEPREFRDGRYQLWIVGAAGPMTLFYYDAESQALLGSEWDFQAPPPGSRSESFPTLVMFSTPMFQPRKNGSISVRWRFDYDRAVRGDRPEFAHHVVAFVPPSLAAVNPYRIDQTTLRPYISDPLPAAEAMAWSDYLSGGLLFNVAVEPPEYYQEPPLATLIATYSGATVIGGGVPRNATLDWDAILSGAAPPIRPWEGAARCEDHYAGMHLGQFEPTQKLAVACSDVP
jgi:hypothetical protein